MSFFSLNTLYKKVVFWSIVVVGPVGFGVYHVRAYLYRHQNEGYSQRLYFNRVQSYVDELKPALGENYNEVKLRRLLRKLQVQHPWKDFYILDQDGKILVHEKDPAVPSNSAEPKFNTIDIKAIKDFVRLERASEKGLYTPDPYSPETLGPYIAAEISLGETLGYLYVVLFKTLNRVGLEYEKPIPWYYDWIVVIGCITVVVGILLARLFVRPIRKILGVVQMITEGSLSERISVKGRDELAQLGAKINSMADTIESMVGQLKRTDRLQREMVSALSHDFGTPLFSAEAYLKRVIHAEENLNYDQKKEFLEVSLRNLEKLRELVRAFFELSKLDASDVAPALEPFSVLDVVTEEVIPKLQPIAEQHQVVLRAEYDLRLPRVLADPALIERALTNLITNGIRYNRPGGAVLVRLTRKNDKVELQISDTGIGISEEDLPFIFDRFYRADRARSGSSGGSGLGLAIVKKILEAHNETISVSSSLDQGTSFTFSLKSVPMQNPSPGSERSF